MTLKQMCEYIAESKILKNTDGSYPTPVEIFNYSPTGELFMVFEWYQEAKTKSNENRS